MALAERRYKLKKTPGPFPVRESTPGHRQHPLRRQISDEFLNHSKRHCGDSSCTYENARLLQTHDADMTFVQQQRASPEESSFVQATLLLSCGSEFSSWPKNNVANQ